MLITESLNKNQGIIDPALYTLPEYLDIANPGRKSHDPKSYTSNTKQLSEYFKKTDYPELIQQKTIRGINFEVLAKQIDKLEKQYAKLDNDGKYVYVNGELSMLSKEEKNYSSLIKIDTTTSLLYTIPIIIRWLVKLKTNGVVY